MNIFFAGNSDVRRLTERIREPALLLACALHLCACAHAEDPATAPVKEPVYRSVFRHYQGFSDVPVAPWPTVNQTVGSVGGWRAYAQEAAAARGAAHADSAATAFPPPLHPFERPQP